MQIACKVIEEMNILGMVLATTQFSHHPSPHLSICSEGMRLFFLVAVTLVSLTPEVVRGGEKKKLQIGIKKRVDNCPIKSRKGDVLNMHYTVSNPTQQKQQCSSCCHWIHPMMCDLCLLILYSANTYIFIRII